MNRKENIQSLGDALKLLVDSLGIGGKIDQYKVFDVWNAAVGPQVAKVAQPQRIQNGILIVAVTNGPWRAELTFRKKEILDRICRETGSAAITDIIFR